MMINYAVEDTLDHEEFKLLLINSSLGERRPVDDEGRIKQMVQGATLIVTARLSGNLVGVARSLTDFSFCTYLSDLAVDEKYQHKGIGKELIRQTKLAAPQATVILVSAPKAVDYYPKIGMTKREHCFVLTDADDLK